jgi:predicted enzyme related to lactoylglutathione lyase
MTTMSASRRTFIWYTHDTKAAASFYGDVIGWGAQGHQMPDNRIYPVFSKRPTMVAGLMRLAAF